VLSGFWFGPGEPLRGPEGSIRRKLDVPEGRRGIMKDPADRDRRQRFRGYSAPVVAGGKRPVTAYLEEGEYVQRVGAAEALERSVASLVREAVGAFVSRKSIQAVL